MKIRSLRTAFLIAIALSGTNSTFGDETVLTGLISKDRTARRNAVEGAERLSKEELIALAQTAIDSGWVKQFDAIHAFHHILEIARNKGFGVGEAVVMLEAQKSSDFKLAILDWLREFGVKEVHSEDAIGLLTRIGRHFMDRNNELGLRLAAHSVCRDLAWKAKSILSEREPGKVTEPRRGDASAAIRAHIGRVCRIIEDPDETDSAVKALAGYVPYYSSAYVRDGLYEKARLRSSVERALREKRGKECEDALMKVLSANLEE